MSDLFTKAQMYSQQPGHLNEPADVIGVHAVFNGPLSQLVPFVPGAAVDGQTELGVLVLTLLQVKHHLLNTHRETSQNQSKRQQAEDACA